MRALVLVLLLVPATAYAVNDTRGYVGRACGFDVDGDGTPGEASDCGYCDDAASFNSQTQIYVDCTAGDDANAGTSASPKRTITNARNAMSGGNVICFKGTCNDVEDLSLPSGAAGTQTVAPRGNEVYSFQYPDKPTMIVGWDNDGDKSYPPFDANDTAVIDGTNSRDTVFNNTLPASRLELAHFTVKNYKFNTAGGETNATFFRNTSNQGMSHTFFHDLSLENMNKDEPDGLTMISALGHKNWDYMAMENVRCLDCGGDYVVYRGGAGDGSNGLFSQYWRWKNLTVQMDGGDSSTDPSLFDGWGAIGGPNNDGNSGMEVIDSIFDCNPEKFTAGTGAQCNGFASHAGLDGQNIVNNEFIDFRIGYFGEVDDGNASGAVLSTIQRPTDHISIRRNVFRVPQASIFGKRVFGVQIFNGSSSDPLAQPYETIGNLTIQDNLFLAGGKGYSSCFDLDGSHFGAAQSGTWTVNNNTCISSAIDGGRALLYVLNGLSNSTTNATGPTSFIIKNNIFATADTVDKSVDVQDLADITGGSNIDYNAYPATTNWQWKANGTTASIAGWRLNSSSDTNSSQCAVTWAETGSTSLPAADGHLSGSDTCASALGTLVGGLDIDEDAHANDRGYDEIVGGPGTIALKSSPYSVTEGTATVTITAQRVGGSTGAVGVSYATSNGTATAGSDYTAASGTLSWISGNAADKTFTVTITNDVAVEPSENFHVTLSTPTGGAALGSPSDDLVTIADNDASAGVIGFSAATAFPGENTTLLATCTRTGGSSGAVGATLDTASQTATGGAAPCSAGEDYITITNSTTLCAWADGDAVNKTVPVTICDDATAEATEKFTLTLTAPSGGSGLGTNAVLTAGIVDNDGGLLADWRTTAKGAYFFEEAANAAAQDETINNNDLTDHNSIARDTSNFKQGLKAGNFAAASDEYFDCADATCPTLGLVGSATVCAWVRPTGSGGQNIAKKHNGSTGYKLRWDGTNTRYQFSVNGSTVSSAIGSGPTDTFAHVCGRIQSGVTNGLEIFVNAVQSGSQATVAGGIQNNTAAFTVSDEDAGFDFNGQIDEVVIFGAALADSNISRIASGHVAGDLLACDSSNGQFYMPCDTNADCAAGSAVCDTGADAIDDDSCIENPGHGCCMGYNSTDATGADISPCNQGAFSTVPECADAEFPECSGNCSVGSTCEAVTAACVCMTPPTTTLPIPEGEQGVISQCKACVCRGCFVP